MNFQFNNFVARVGIEHRPMLYPLSFTYKQHFFNINKPVNDFVLFYMLLITIQCIRPIILCVF